MVPGSPAQIDALVALRSTSATCTNCSLAGGRTNVVFGVGNVNRPPVAFVGEAPGETEDLQGLPFVGRAGKILDEWITWMGYTREQVYILNTVMCRPPGNRKPWLEELKACCYYFETQLELIKPLTIVTLGRTAAEALLGVAGTPLRILRGMWRPMALGRVRVTYHPAFIARSPKYMTEVYEDLKAVREMVDELSR